MIIHSPLAAHISNYARAAQKKIELSSINLNENRSTLQVRTCDPNRTFALMRMEDGWMEG